MADIISGAERRPPAVPAVAVAPPLPDRPESPPLYDLIELLYFAYRDFVGGADEKLMQYGFGRAHHRVLHFVDRHPGLTVADLLDILRITKQSLGRVLKELVDQGFVEQREGEADRRQRRLATTPRGARLARDLAALQTERIAGALAETGGPGAHDTAHDMAARFLFTLIDPGDRAGVERLIQGSGFSSSGFSPPGPEADA